MNFEYYIHTTKRKNNKKSIHKIIFINPHPSFLQRKICYQYLIFYVRVCYTTFDFYIECGFKLFCLDLLSHVVQLVILFAASECLAENLICIKRNINLIMFLET